MYSAALDDEAVWQAFYPGWCHTCNKQQPQIKGIGYYLTGSTECKVCYEAMLAKAQIDAREICEAANRETQERIKALNIEVQNAGMTYVVQKPKESWWKRILQTLRSAK